MHSFTLLATLVTVAAAAHEKGTFAVLQHVGDGPLMNCRIDPIVSPGGPSSHVHTFFGGNNIGFNTTGESLRQSSCTTTRVKVDMSGYWFPTLHFKDPATGKLEPVPFYYMNVYYFFDATNDDIKSFPLGLNLVSGDAALRAPPTKTGITNLDPKKGPLSPAQITCPRTNFNPPSWPAGSDGSQAGIGAPIDKGLGIGFPLQDCDGQYSPMRIDVHFPSCYNPAAGLTDYKSNSAFPSDAGGGKVDCPKGWIHLPHMFFESYWNTHDLAPRFKNLIGKESPFVFSNGDTTGYSAHADFISGWDEKALQQIIDNCNVGHGGMHTCPGLIGGVNNGGSCKATCPVDEDVKGPFDKLPGNNPLSGFKYGAGSGGGSQPAVNPPANPPANSPPVASPTYGNPSNQSPSTPDVDTDPYPAPDNGPIPVPTTLVPSIKVAAAPSSEDSAPSPTPKADSPAAPASAGKTSTVWDTVTVWQTKTVYGSGSKPTGTSTTKNSSAKPIKDFEPVGCYRDGSKRVLSGEIFPKLGKVSMTSCVEYCDSKDFTYAGTEYGGECFCGKGLNTIDKIADGECKMPCQGDASETCGGSWALTLYTKGGVAPAKVARRHVHDHFMHHRRGHSHMH